MNYRISALLTAAAMLIAGTACGDEASSKAAESSLADSSSTAETAASDASSAADSSEAGTSSQEDSSQPAEQNGLPAMTEAVQELKCLDINAAVNKVISSADNKIALSCYEGSGNTFYVIDPAQDKLIRSGSIAGDEEELLGLRPDGSVLTLDFENKKLYIYPADGSETKAVDIPSDLKQPVYDSTGDRVIRYGRSIDALDIDTGKSSELVPIDSLTNTILDVDPAKGIYAANRISAEKNGTCKCTVCSLEDGSELAPLPIYNSKNTHLSKSYTAAITHENEDLEEVLSLYSLTDGSHTLSFKSPEKASSPIFSPYSDFIVSPSSNTNGNEWESYITFIDTASAEYGEIHFEDNQLYGLKMTASPSGRWFAGITRGSGDDSKTSLLMFDPSLVKERKPLETAVQPDSEEPKLHTCNSYYAEERERADKLEEKYGVKIQFSDEVLDLDGGMQYKFNPLTPDNCDHEIAGAYLDNLEHHLAKYPEGFFKKFITPAGGGLRLTLVDSIVRADTEKDDAFQAAGVTFESGAWVDIVYTASSAEPYTGVIHHELWHAVEDLVERADPIDEEAWKKLLPEDFSYTVDNEQFATSSINDDYTLSGDGEAYFIEAYSKVNEKEDRATTIERVMLVSFENDDTLSAVSDHPHLQAKADFLADWIEPYFGYAYFKGA